jgi:hypothetical protein
MRASDAAPQLVRLREAESIGAMNEDGSGRTSMPVSMMVEQSRRLSAADEVASRAPTRARASGRGDCQARLGHQRGKPFTHGDDGVDVAEKIDLTAALWSSRSAASRTMPEEYCETKVLIASRPGQWRSPKIAQPSSDMASVRGSAWR